MTVIAVLDFTFKPETLAEALPVVHEVLQVTRAFAGCQSVDVMVDQADAAHLVVVERWESLEADEAYRTFRAGPGAPTALAPFLAGAPVLTKGVLDPAV
ncbi:antibiotic biosynthesis monooxygenase [Kineosporia sp. NBRC 101731]|uniref:putative quinol monooxygenase n=1 Tax=Kineosporia sp. NBRC 101731 TaxID=3032199 RepID=UPI0024A51EE3|nr:antibiotic biosynthesis monooxygenase [Kineosporia sp. NBRC 101731]GLY29414.1 antibiotic biosynthesis monooxygenase [Kineosporia sp. NBRC 101731]